MFKYPLLLILLIFSSGLCSKTNLSNILSYDSDHLDPNILFEQINDKKQEISGLHIHFLTGENCYSGWSGMYSLDNVIFFIVKPHIKFGFDQKLIYQAALDSIKSDQVSSIKFMLVRFIRTKDTAYNNIFARFIGSCSDQAINCCIPIKCNSQTLDCISTHRFATQEILWTKSRKN